MQDITTATGSTVPEAAIKQLLFTEDWLTGVRATANVTLTGQADYAYKLAYALSGGGELHPDAHSAAVTNLLHSVTPGIVAFALHHLRPLLPDLTDEQWARIDAAAVALDLQVCEDLSGATIVEEPAGPAPAHAPLPPGETGRAVATVGDDDFDYSRHAPVKLPLGPWQCIDRACGEYEAPDGSDLPDVEYCSHVTVLVLCSACSGAGANHAIRLEVPWADCDLKRP
ncbi:hypothetical protein [Streptomyces cinereoruber]|uniref:hypothetical protein n=1 Tax=Streptomyces cinereoruber TaxID=67260 RepID=UPI003641551A